MELLIHYVLTLKVKNITVMSDACLVIHLFIMYHIVPTEGKFVVNSLRVNS